MGLFNGKHSKGHITRPTKTPRYFSVPLTEEYPPMPDTPRVRHSKEEIDEIIAEVKSWED